MDNNVSLERLGFFTASEIHRITKSGRAKDVIFGEGAITYINEKIAEIITGERKGSPATVATEWGIVNEADAIATYEKLSGKKVEYFGSSNPKFFMFNDISGASPDGLIGEDSGIEAKCPYVSSNHIETLLNQENGQQWLKNNHYDYYCQCQFQMLATKRDKWMFISYDPRTVDYKHRLAIIELAKDNELCADIEKRLVAAKEIVKNALSILNRINQ